MSACEGWFRERARVVRQAALEVLGCEDDADEVLGPTGDGIDARVRAGVAFGRSRQRETLELRSGRKCPTVAAERKPTRGEVRRRWRHPVPGQEAIRPRGARDLGRPA